MVSLRGGRGENELSQKYTYTPTYFTLLGKDQIYYRDTTYRKRRLCYKYK